MLDQLRCSGVIEAVRVMQEAFPTRIPYEDIHGRYDLPISPLYLPYISPKALSRIEEELLLIGECTTNIRLSLDTKVRVRVRVRDRDKG